MQFFFMHSCWNGDGHKLPSDFVSTTASFSMSHVKSEYWLCIENFLYLYLYKYVELSNIGT